MSRILKGVHKSSTRLHEAGYIDAVKMRELDALCLPERLLSEANRELSQTDDIPDNWRDDPLENTPPIYRDRHGKR